MIKLIIFDAYGVFLHGGYPLTMQALGQRFHRDWEELYAIFYTKYFNQAAERKISQQQAWEYAIRETGLPTTVAAIKRIHYGFMGINRQVLGFIRQLPKRYRILLLCKNTRSQFHDACVRLPKLQHTFGRHMLNTWEHRLPKASPKTIQLVLRRYRVRPQEVISIDDQAMNLEASRKLGVHTILYKDFSQFQTAICPLLRN